MERPHLVFIIVTVILTLCPACSEYGEFAPAMRKLNARVLRPLTFVGVNYNTFAPCTGPTGNNSIQLLANYHIPTVRDTARSQLADTKKNGLSSLRTMVFFFAGTSDESTTSDGVVNINNRTARAEYLKNLQNYLLDVKAAGFVRLTLSFNPMRLNSPLDYVRRWTLPANSPLPIPAFCGNLAADSSAYSCATANADFMSQVINAVESAQSTEFEIYYDLLNEVNTSFRSEDAVARDYARYIWQWFVTTYGADHGGFAAVLDGGSLTGYSGTRTADFESLLAAYSAVKIGGVAQYPGLHQFQMYNSANSDEQIPAEYSDGGQSFLRVRNLFDSYRVPSDHRRIQIAETYYNYLPSARQAYAALALGLTVEELLVWPAKFQDIFYGGSCAVTVSAPFGAASTLAVAKNGNKVGVSRILNAGYYRPNNRIWIQFRGDGGVVPLFANMYDWAGHFGERSLTVDWVSADTSTVSFTPDPSMQSVLQSTVVTISLWMTDGSQTQLFPLPACGANWEKCQ